MPANTYVTHNLSGRRGQRKWPANRRISVGIVTFCTMFACVLCAGMFRRWNCRSCHRGAVVCECFDQQRAGGVRAPAVRGARWGGVDGPSEPARRGAAPSSTCKQRHARAVNRDVNQPPYSRRAAREPSRTLHSDADFCHQPGLYASLPTGSVCKFLCRPYPYIRYEYASVLELNTHRCAVPTDATEMQLARHSTHCVAIEERNALFHMTALALERRRL